ncbi:MAG: IS30 family transposase [Sporolactobacillus sp.]
MGIIIQAIICKECLNIKDFHGLGIKARESRLETRGRIKADRSIDERPETVNDRRQFGHWELDTVVSPRGKDKACLATFVERQTRYDQALLIPGRTAEAMNAAVETMCARFPSDAFQTATVDRGQEFAKSDALETERSLKFYFADPYASWQRGTNENHNGFIREFFPKGTRFSTVTQAEVDQAVQLINQRPRRCLGWQTAQESFREALLHLA